MRLTEEPPEYRDVTLRLSRRELIDLTNAVMSNEDLDPDERLRRGRPLYEALQKVSGQSQSQPQGKEDP